MKPIVISGVRSVRSLSRHIPASFLDCPVRVGFHNPTPAHLARIGFSPSPSPGDTVLPATVGRFTERNARGREKPLRHLPMETVYHSVWHEWQDWHGNWHGKFVDIPYERYPRQHVPPDGLHLTYQTDSQNNAYVVLNPIPYTASNAKMIRHALNLTLEIFGEAHIFPAGLMPPLPPLRYVNWEILRPGTWCETRKIMDTVIERLPAKQQRFVQERWDHLEQYRPSIRAVGLAGFHGYLVFCFSDKNVYIAESAYTGNATYVLGSDWEQVTQGTKWQAQASGQVRERIIHDAHWRGKITRMLL